VDAANPKEDVTPSGVQVFGQSETSIASVGPYVVEAWNDATGLIAPCGSQMFKEEVTSYGFSADGGASWSFTGNYVATSTFGEGSDPNAPFIDKMYMTIDNNPASPFADRIYVVWANYAADGTAAEAPPVRVG